MAMVKVTGRKNTEKNAEKKTEGGEGDSSSCLLGGKSYVFVGSSKRKSRANSIEKTADQGTGLFDRLMKVMSGQLETVKKNLKLLMAINPRALHNQ